MPRGISLFAGVCWCCFVLFSLHGFILLIPLADTKLLSLCACVLLLTELQWIGLCWFGWGSCHWEWVGSSWRRRWQWQWRRLWKREGRGGDWIIFLFLSIVAVTAFSYLMCPFFLYQSSMPAVCQQYASCMPDINLSSPCPPPPVQCSNPFPSNAVSNPAWHHTSFLPFENKTHNSGVRWVLPLSPPILHPTRWMLIFLGGCYSLFDSSSPRRSDPTPSLPCLHQLITDLLSLLLPIPSPLVNPVVQIVVTCNTFKAPLRLPVWFDPSIHSIQMSVCRSVWLTCPGFPPW